MTVLVTGATGFIGTYVARLLADRGRRSRLMFRRPRRAESLKELDAELVIADLRSKPSLARAAGGSEAVIHLAGRATFEPYEVVAPTLVGGTRAMAEAAAEAGVEVFVLASSTAVYPSSPRPITKETPPDPAIGYGQAKTEAEAALALVAADSGMRAVSLRLPHVYGAGSILFGYLSKGLVPFAGSMDAVYSHLHAEDAARALVAAVDENVEGPLPVGDRRPVAWSKFFETVRGYRPDLRVLDLPERLIESALRWLEPLRPHRRPSMATPDAVRSWRMDQHVDAEATWEALGTEPAYPTIETGIPAGLEAALLPGWSRSLSDRRR